jgi:hypothetical protein
MGKRSFVSLRARLVQLTQQMADACEATRYCRCPRPMEFIEYYDDEPEPPWPDACPSCSKPFKPGVICRVIIPLGARPTGGENAAD